MTEIRLGISPCPNDVYVFSGAITGQAPADGLRFRIDYEDVETLNARARRGDGDVVKISYANYRHCAGTYELLSCGGALGRGCGPLLLSNGGDWSPEREVLVPGEFTTANFLLDYYLPEPVRKTYLPFDVLYERLRREPGSQGVVIHEKRFTYEKDGLTLVQDLGAFWEERTGFAIPLGAIAARRELGLRDALEAVIRESLAWADAHPAEALALCREHAQDLDETVIRSHIALYVNDFTRDLGEEGQAAVDFFLEQQRKPSA